MHNLAMLAAELFAIVNILMLAIVTLTSGRWWLSLLSLAGIYASYKITAYVYVNYGAGWGLETAMAIFLAIVIIGVATSD